MPYHEPVSAALMGLVTGLGSAVVQANALPANPLVVPIVSAIVGGLMSFAVLKTTVRVVERDLKEIKDDVKDINKRVSRIEGAIE